jgi:hypothetical protein
MIRIKRRLVQTLFPNPYSRPCQMYRMITWEADHFPLKKLPIVQHSYFQITIPTNEAMKQKKGEGDKYTHNVCIHN